MDYKQTKGACCLDEEGTALNYDVLEKAVSRVRKCGSAVCMAAEFDDGDWKAEIDQDFKARGGKRSKKSV